MRRSLGVEAAKNTLSVDIVDEHVHEEERSIDLVVVKVDIRDASLCGLLIF